MKTKFKELATDTFKLRRGGMLTYVDPLQVASMTLMVLGIFVSKYHTTPLRNGLIRLFGEDLNLYSSTKVKKLQRPTRVAVASTKDIGASRCLITNYNRPDFSSGDDFEHEDEDAKEMRVWEAGLATASAPYYFRPFEKAETMKNYVDGALHANLPIRYALEEMANLWPNPDRETLLDALVSVGTGIQKEPDTPRILGIGGFKQIYTDYHSNIDTERLWEIFINDSSYSVELRHKIHRLNAYIENDHVAIDDYKKMGAMEDMASRQMDGSARCPSPLAMDIAKAADILTASLFFFEPDPFSFADTNFGGSAAAASGRCELKVARSWRSFSI
jgi:predicted acylesterase/phospholipase RssA